MARRRKTIAQQVVNAATITLPEPARRVFGSRLGAMLLLIAVPLLVITGILNLTWENGRPKATIDRERAEEIAKKVREEAKELRQEWQAPENRDSEEPLARIRDKLLPERR